MSREMVRVTGYYLYANTVAQFTATVTVLDTLLVPVMNAADRKKC